MILKRMRLRSGKDPVDARPVNLQVVRLPGAWIITERDLSNSKPSSRPEERGLSILITKLYRTGTQASG
jgi:hypothetical protein